MTLRAYLIIAALSLLMLLPHVWKRDPVPDMAHLGAAAPGCIGDFLTGVLDCMATLPDGSWIHKRSY